jgi:hypothetical protein
MEQSLTGVNGPDSVKILVVDDQPAKLLSYEVVLAGVGATLSRHPGLAKRSNVS